MGCPDIGQILFWVCLWECFWIRSTFELVDWVEQMLFLMWWASSNQSKVWIQQKDWSLPREKGTSSCLTIFKLRHLLLLSSDSAWNTGFSLVWSPLAFGWSYTVPCSLLSWVPGFQGLSMALVSCRNCTRWLLIINLSLSLSVHLSALFLWEPWYKVL